MNRIGIIGAMDEEVDILVELMDIKETIEKASLKFYKGTLEGKDIVLVRCGIGKVNSALCAQILIGRYRYASSSYKELDIAFGDDCRYGRIFLLCENSLVCTGETLFERVGGSPDSGFDFCTITVNLL